MDERPLARLCPAFLFTCEECGKDTFTRSVAVEDPETEAKAFEAFKRIIEETDGEEAAEQWDGVITMAPTVVTCGHCGTEYDVATETYDLEGMGMFLDDLEDDMDDDDIDEVDDDDDDDWEDDDFDDEDDDLFDDEDVEEDF